MPTFTKQSDAVQKIQVESHLIYAIWSHARAHAGQEAAVEVRTSFVGEGARIKITCYTEKGKKLDKVDGTVLNNRYKGNVMIPDNVKPDDMIYFEAELPKHGLKGESNLIPVRPAIQVTSIKWDRKEVKREDIVTMTCQFQSGVEDGDEATVIIYEHNPNSCDFKVVSIPTTIKSNKIEMQWEFDYQDPTDQIPTDGEMKPYQKNYANPQFFFMVLVDGIRIGERRESGLMKFKDWVEVALKDEEGNACPKAQGSFTLPDGAKKDFTLDEKGTIRLDDVAPGEIAVVFKDIKRIEYIGSNNNVFTAATGKVTIQSGASYQFQSLPFNFSE